MQIQNQKRNRHVTAQWVIILVLTILVPAAGCTQNMERKTMSKNNEQSITYGAGRFVIDIPVSMQFSGGYSLVDRDLTEMVRPNSDLNKEALTEWDLSIQKIKRITPPAGKEIALIEEREITGIGKWCKAALYYHEPFDSEYGSLDLLLSSGKSVLWIRTRDKKIAAKDIVYGISSDLARAYRPPTSPNRRVEVIPGKDSFYLRYGAIDLPFEYEESVDIVFSGHSLDEEMSLEIETDVLQEPETESLIDQLTAIIVTKWAPGFEIDKIRTRKRTAAGLKGEEVVYLGTETDTNDKNYYFMWGYPGKKDDAHHPFIKISMSAKADRLEEKLALWDAVLDSMRPAGR